MDRKLLLLGLLRMQEMHGYQVNEMINTHLGTSVQIKRPTVYKLLGDMEENGWITFREEQEGNYPPRRVYAITREGESTFRELLRESVANYRPPSYLSNIGMVFLDAIPVDEVVILLAKRREDVKNLLDTLADDEQHGGEFAMMLSHHNHHLRAELNWLDEVVDNLRSLDEQLSSQQDR